jgi:methionyl-tRNA formyltransferase
MRVLFMGTPEFAVPTLRAVLRAHEVACVVTQPDKPAGRGRSVEAPPVKLVAQEAGVAAILQPKSARTPEFLADLKAHGPYDVGVVVAYGKILPQTVLDVPRLGCLNVHGSLLPKYRGAAPIQWAVIHGEPETGVTIMQLDAGMDTGPMLLTAKIPIAADDTAGTIHDKLSVIGADLMAEALPKLYAGQLTPITQDHARATMAPMLEKDTGRIDWTKSAREVRDLVRGTDPWPGAFTMLGAEVLKVFRAHVTEGQGEAGRVLGVDRDGLIVACGGGGAVALGELQLPGRKRMAAKALVAGRPIAPGTILGS